MDDKFFEKSDKDRIDEEYKRLTRRMERKKQMQSESANASEEHSKHSAFENPFADQGDKERLDWEYRRLTKRVERKNKEGV
jgi:hypothetical protein